MYICLHCDESAVAPLFDKEDVSHERPFCCEGCLTVYKVIQGKGLGEYYSIKNASNVFKRRAPVEYSKSRFTYLNDPQFLKEYSWTSGNHQAMEFYLEGIHCLACLWLIEKLPEFVKDVHSAKLDLERSVVTVVLNENGQFSTPALELAKLGYRPHPIRKNEETNIFRKREERNWLIRIGISGAAAGNIMLYAVSNYGGASGSYAELFNAISVVFAVPIFTFCAWPFYQNAWNAIKNKTVSIDIPISLSLIMGGLMGVLSMLRGIPDNYFDSLSALVFLLLLSRYFLQKIQEKGLEASDLHFFYQSDSVLIVDDKFADGFREIHPRFIKTGDVLKILPDELIPADGKITKGSSHVNLSLLTGESVPFKVETGDPVFSGTQNLDNEILIEVTKTSDESRLGQILKNVENGWTHKSQIVQLTNNISKYFTVTVITLSVVLFLYLFQSHSFKEALEGAMTLMIVTCPCALALAVPLTFTRSLSKASEEGIIIKSDEVIERLSKIQNIFIDKTGTITFGKIKVVRMGVESIPKNNIYDIIYALEKNSKHPVGVALREFAAPHIQDYFLVTDHMEIPGIGVTGQIHGHHYEINRTGLLEDGRRVATFELADKVRDDSRSSLKFLQKAGFKVHILSGDNREVALQIGKSVQLDPGFIFSELSPENKSEIVRKSKQTMMIGDGANDAIALSEASVGVAVMGSMDISLRAADVYLSTPGLSPVVKLMVLSRETMKVIRRNLVLSLLYNSSSVVFAFTGLISPLVAAIIMPLSSLTVLISTLYGTRELRKLWKS